MPVTPARPWARDDFQQQRGRTGLEVAAAVNEVRRLAKVEKTQQAKALSGSVHVGL